MNPYVHKVDYYETDKMGITHHSNYIRWFESARIDFLDQLGISFAALEDSGLGSPVLSVSCEYRSPARFGDTVQVAVKLMECGGIRFRFAYAVTLPDGTLAAEGETSHCFVNSEGRPVALRRANPELYALMLEQVVKE
ncbi:MAG: acyl-CoA thioesterase [Clostridia bacterium]|nr:acyl-CoA thioesterase [Clostridia bacterium]